MKIMERCVSLEDARKMIEAHGVDIAVTLPLSNGYSYIIYRDAEVYGVVRREVARWPTIPQTGRQVLGMDWIFEHLGVFSFLDPAYDRYRPRDWVVHLGLNSTVTSYVAVEGEQGSLSFMQLRAFETPIANLDGVPDPNGQLCPGVQILYHNRVCEMEDVFPDRRKVSPFGFVVLGNDLVAVAVAALSEVYRMPVVVFKNPRQFSDVEEWHGAVAFDWREIA